MKDELNLAALEEAAELQEELHCNGAGAPCAPPN